VIAGRGFTPDIPFFAGVGTVGTASGAALFSMNVVICNLTRYFGRNADAIARYRITRNIICGALALAKFVQLALKIVDLRVGVFEQRILRSWITFVRSKLLGGLIRLVLQASQL